MEARVIEAIDGHDLGAAALHLEGEPSIPRAYVEHPFAGEVIRDGKLGDAEFLSLQIGDAANEGAIRQFEGMPPSAFHEAAAPLRHVRQRIGARGTHAHSLWPSGGHVRWGRSRQGMPPVYQCARRAAAYDTQNGLGK